MADLSHSSGDDPMTVERRRKNSEKQRRFQARARKGIRLGRFEISRELVNWLVAHEYLPERDEFDLPEIEQAHARFLAAVTGRHFP